MGIFWKLSGIQRKFSLHMFRLPWRYGDGFKKIRILDRSRSYVVLEAFGTPWEVLRAYARLSKLGMIE